MIYKVFVLLMCLAPIVSCQREKDKGSYFLDKDYDFIMGFAVPDEDRLAPTEIFVGRMIDKEPESITFRSGALDSFLLKQVQRYQGWYHFTLIYHDDAEVKISSDEQAVSLSYVGNGIYRDVNNQLNIEALKTYKLEIARPGGRYYSQTVRVPGNFNFTNVLPGDTVGPIFPKYKDVTGFCYALKSVIWNNCEGAHLYRSKVLSDDSVYAGKSVHFSSFVTDDQGMYTFFHKDNDIDTLRWVDWETLAFDSSASRFYQAESPMGLDERIDSFFTYWNQGPIARRNGMDTHGADDVIGNFGAYNAARIHFWIVAKTDSCGM